MPKDWLRQKTLPVLVGVLALGVWALVAIQFSAGGGASAARVDTDARFDRIMVEAIDIVDPDGTVRMTIGNRTNFPPARYRGQEIERSIDDAVGLVFYEANGDEAGGLIQASLRDQNQSALILDYTHQITDGIGLIKQEGADGEEWRAGLFISDRRPYVTGPLTSSQGVERILLSNSNQDAALVISDPAGNPRIRIGVDRDGVAFMIILDKDGEIVSSMQ